MSTAERSRGTVALLSALVAAALVAVGVAVLGGDDEPSAGPLGSDDAQGLGFAQEVGRELTFGLPVAFNRGDKPAVLDRLSLVRVTPGLHLFATRVAGPRRRLLFQANDSRWPSPSVTDQHPARGYQVAPQARPEGKRGVELLLGLRADKLGRYTAGGVQVDYHVGDTAHRSVLRSALRVCTVRKGVRPERHECPPPKPVAASH
jgi:hypothetical protein